MIADLGSDSCWEFLMIPRSQRAQVYTIRVFHKWTNNKWKARERAGNMAIIECCVDADKSWVNGYSSDNCTQHGAN